MRLDHLLSREYITTDQVQIEWREEFRLKFVESYIVFKVLGGLKWTRTTDLTLIRRAL